jgi:hypothetical protein
MNLGSEQIDLIFAYEKEKQNALEERRDREEFNRELRKEKRENS